MNWKTHSLVKQGKVSDFLKTGLAHSLIKSSGLLNNSNLLFFYLGVSFWRVLVRFLSLGAHRARIQIVLVISGRLPGHRTFPPVPLHHRTQYALLRSTHNSTSRTLNPLATERPNTALSRVSSADVTNAFVPSSRQSCPELNAEWNFLCHYKLFSCVCQASTGSH